MKKIGLLSDTHGFIDPKVYSFFADCDEIWHAGDFGNVETADALAAFKPLRGAYGNIDDSRMRLIFPKNNKFTCEGVKVWITHIGGYPGHYEQSVKAGLINEAPNLFICGHSHILKVVFDKHFNMLCMNPGAAGDYGFHKVKTLLRFEIDKSNIQNLEIMEIERNRNVK